MLKMVIEYDVERIKYEDIVKVEVLHELVDKAIYKIGLRKVAKGVYTDAGNMGDLTKFFAIISWLQKAEWFKRYATRWDWYNDHAGAVKNVMAEDLLRS